MYSFQSSLMRLTRETVKIPPLRGRIPAVTGTVGHTQSRSLGKQGVWGTTVRVSPPSSPAHLRHSPRPAGQTQTVFTVASSRRTMARVWPLKWYQLRCRHHGRALWHHAVEVWWQCLSYVSALPSPPSPNTPSLSNPIDSLCRSLRDRRPPTRSENAPQQFNLFSPRHEARTPASRFPH